MIWNLTLANRRLNVSSKATLTFQLNRSPKIRISGPVMLTTEGFRASAEVSLITSPKAFAASSFCSGLPVRTPSRSTGRMEVTPCHGNQTRKLEPTMQTNHNLLFLTPSNGSGNLEIPYQFPTHLPFHYKYFYSV